MFALGSALTATAFQVVAVAPTMSQSFARDKTGRYANKNPDEVAANFACDTLDLTCTESTVTL